MKKKNLTITVSGQVASGKSRLSYLLKKFLREQGFEVEFEDNLDFLNESEFDAFMCNNFEEVIEDIKETRKITLREEQLPIKE